MPSKGKRYMADAPKRAPGGQPGNRNSAGRDTKTQKREERAKQVNYAVALLEKDYREKTGEDPGMPFDGDAVAFMQMIYKCPAFPLAIRYDAAKNAAPYERPRLQAVLMNVDPTTGKAVTPPPPPSLLVEWDGGVVDVSNFNSDSDVTDVVDVVDEGAAPAGGK